MARNAVAMPAAVWKKRRRLMPRRFAIRAPISLTRASNSRCFAVCGPGMNSSLETDCTGIGEGNSDSAGESRASSSGESMLMGVLLFVTNCLSCPPSRRSNVTALTAGMAPRQERLSYLQNHVKETQMLKKPLMVATLAAAMATATISTEAAAGDPLLGALIGGGIGAAVGHGHGRDGGVVGGVLGAIVGSSIAANSGGYYDGYGPRYYDDGYYAPAAPVYSAPAYYGLAYGPAYYGGATIVYRSHSNYAYRGRDWRDRRGEGRDHWH